MKNDKTSDAENEVGSNSYPFIELIPDPASSSLQPKGFTLRWPKRGPDDYSEVIWFEYPEYPEGFRYDRKSKIGVNRMFASNDLYIVDVWKGWPHRSNKHICSVFINVKTGKAMLHTHDDDDPGEEWIEEQLVAG